MAVARSRIEQLLVVQREQRALAIRLQRDRYLGFPFRRRMPGPVEHQKLVRHHLAINPADFVIFVVRGETDAKTSADPRVDLGLERVRLGVRASEPADYFLRVGLRGVDFRRRAIETAFEVEARSGDKAGVAGSAWFGGHLSSSTKAARRSRFSDQKRW